MRRRLRCRPVVFWVISPEYNGASYYAPPDPGRDVLAVFARSARRAKVLAVRAWRRRRARYIGRISDNPFVGVRVDRARLVEVQ